MENRYCLGVQRGRPVLDAVGAEERVAVRVVIVPARHIRSFVTEGNVTFGHGFGCMQTVQPNCSDVGQAGGAVRDVWGLVLDQDSGC